MFSSGRLVADIGNEDMYRMYLYSKAIISILQTDILILFIILDLYNLAYVYEISSEA